ncbi:MFS transporter [Pengzhenrongella frigida]|uniref:MFS transporter n=1 Tax=Pengzhenrongella frigida TaxID=1259133 RepID=A0A4Q5MZL0_9MICO|nr:MFS transporter [Cellulomonas sp. HLT2-17]RYV51208.1 MFS transporter [Cellulomonas sp. HLT2-17]
MSVGNPSARRRPTAPRALAGLLVAHTLAAAGNVVTFVALPLYVLAETGSPAMAGVLAVATTLPVVVGGAFGGVLVDRFGYRRSSVLSDVVGAVTVGAIPLLHVTVGLPFGVLLALVFATGLLDTPGKSARTALVPEAASLAGVPLERALGWWGAASRGAMLVGAPVAGLLVAWWGPLLVLVVNAAAFLASAVVVAVGVPARLRPNDDDAPSPPPGHADPQPGYWRALGEGVRVLWGNPLLRAVVLLVLVTNALDIGRSSVILPVYAERELAGATSLGLLIGASGLGMFVGALLFSALGSRVPRRMVFAVGFLLAGGPQLIVLALRPGLGWCLLAAVLAGLAAGSINPILDTVLLEQVPPSMRARVFGVVDAGCWAAMPVGALATGFLVEGLGLVPSLLLLGATYLLVTLAPFVGSVWAGLDRRLLPVPDPDADTVVR